MQQYLISPLIKNKRTFNLFSGFVSGLISCVVSQPLEVIKTQIIVNPNKLKEIEKGNQLSQIFYAIKIIYAHQNGGINNFMRGGLISSIRQGLGFGMYQVFLEAMNQNMPKKIPKYVQYTLNSFVGKSLALILCNPLIILKTRKEIISTNLPTSTNFFQGINNIIKEDGIKGLFKGTSTMISREVTFTVCHYNLYQFLKEKMPKSKFFPPFLAAIGATCISHPFEVVRNRMMVQNKFVGGQQRQYTGILDGLTKIVKYEGTSGLFKGFFIRFLRKPLNSTITWILFEKLKEYQKQQSNNKL